MECEEGHSLELSSMYCATIDNTLEGGSTKVIHPPPPTYPSAGPTGPRAIGQQAFGAVSTSKKKDGIIVRQSHPPPFKPAEHVVRIPYSHFVHIHPPVRY